MIGSRSIRFRLTLWYTIVLALGLVLLGSFLWLAMRHQLYADIDNGLRSRGEALERYLIDEGLDDPEHLHDEVGEFVRALPADYELRIADSAGRPVYATHSANALFRNIPEADDDSFHLRANGRDFRVRSHRTRVGGHPLWLVIASGIDRTEEVLSQLRTLLVTAIPGVVLLAAVGGYLLSGRALAPVDVMTRTARLIGIENLSARLPVPATQDEIQRLAQTWNEMLARLETAVTRISQFTSDASHELRTPIALIRSTAEIALRRPRPEAQYRQYLEQIEVESERMTQLVEDLLFLARSDAQAVAAKMGPVDARVVMQDACAEIAPRAAEKGVSFQIAPCDCAMVLTGREHALRRMLLALLDNALKYTPAGGAISLSAERSGAEWVLTVRDTGIGIAETALPHIFERFYRADASRSRDSGGHGLGLAIAQTIARQHNGAIVAESRVDEGSAFRVVLPAANAC